MTEVLVQGKSRVTSTPFAHLTTIRLNGDITCPEDWMEEIEALENAAPNDVVNILINCRGGCIDTTIEFLTAMAKCQGKVTTELVGCAYSAATFILLSGEEIIINEGTDLMIHEASSGAVDTVSKMQSSINHTHTRCGNLMRKLYEGFLLPDEIESVLKGQDVWMEDEEILDRLNKREDYFERAAEEAAKEGEESVDFSVE